MSKLLLRPTCISLLNVCKPVMCTCIILLTPDCTAVLGYGENQTSQGTRFIDECKQIINALKCQYEHFSYVKEYKYEAAMICSYVYQLHNTQNVYQWKTCKSEWRQFIHIKYFLYVKNKS